MDPIRKNTESISNGASADTSVPPLNPEQKYIRTYAGDMEVAQKGGTPDLVPLVPQPVPVSMPPAAVKDQIPTPPSTVQRPIDRPIPTPVPDPSPLHTYSEDFADKVKTEQASTATVLAAEQDATSLGGGVEPPEPEKHRLIYAVAGVLMLVLGGGGAYYAYSLYAASNAPVVVEQKATAPIFVDEQQEIVGDGVALWQAIQQSVSRTLASGTVRLLYSANATTTRRSIFVTMQPPAPDILIRNIKGADSMVGVIYVGVSQSPFFILNVSTYNDTFAGMLSWERTIIKDLVSLFPEYAPPLVLASSTLTAIIPVATTTATSTSVVVITPPFPRFVASFHDEVIANHDVRIYRDAFNQSVLLYGYWNQSTLIIARDPNAFVEIVERLATSHTRR